MYFSFFRQSAFYYLVKFLHGSSIGNPAFQGKIFNRRLWTHPDNIIHIGIISEDPVFARIEIHQSCKTGNVESEKIQKIAILSEMVSICRIIQRSFIISNE